jgi:hypothetical protein
MRKEFLVRMNRVFLFWILEPEIYFGLIWFIWGVFAVGLPQINLRFRKNIF